jgi:OHCU decarboxylase
MQTTLRELNNLDCAGFTKIVGPLFEHSPWIAERTWIRRPFPDLEALHAALCDTVSRVNESQQLELIRAHPDLVGRAAQGDSLTPESASEQASAGLGKLTPREIELFQNQNRAYHEKFGFPFIICARLNKKEAILAGFAERLRNSRSEELKTALGEIYKIARLRLADRVTAGN